PQSPETRFELARLEARLGEDDEAIKNLRIAIELGDKRLRANPDAFDIRAAARAAADFNSLRDRGDFQTLVSP
ncbi:MAG: TPR end-of-group domain-containing protein, partial [Limisphaerales bacterium]